MEMQSGSLLVRINGQKECWDVLSIPTLLVTMVHGIFKCVVQKFGIYVQQNNFVKIILILLGIHRYESMISFFCSDV